MAPMPGPEPVGVGVPKVVPLISGEVYTGVVSPNGVELLGKYVVPIGEVDWP